MHAAQCDVFNHRRSIHRSVLHTGPSRPTRPTAARDRTRWRHHAHPRGHTASSPRSPQHTNGCGIHQHHRRANGVRAERRIAARCLSRRPLARVSEEAPPGRGRSVSHAPPYIPSEYIPSVILHTKQTEVLASPLGRKFRTYSKNDLKNSRTVLEGHKLWDLNFGGNEHPNFKGCMGKGGLNSSRYRKKVPTPRTLEPQLLFALASFGIRVRRETTSR
jgi:hypothetical protein